jgi:hypothetical protein
MIVNGENGKADFVTGEATLKKIQDKAPTCGSMEEVIDFIFNEIKTVIPCDRIDVGFLEEDNQRIVIDYIRANYKDVQLEKDYVLDIGSSGPGDALESGECHIINDLAEYRNVSGNESVELLINEGIRSCVTCPVIIDGIKIGLMSCRSRMPGAFAEREAAFLVQVLQRIRIIVEKAFRMRQINRISQTYIDTLSVVSHEIRSPLASMIMLGKTLSSGYFGPMEEKQREIVDRMVRKAEYLHSLSNKYLNLGKCESGQLKINPRLIEFYQDVLEPAEEIIMPQLEERNMHYERDYQDGIYPVLCDPDLICMVLVNLLSNGIKYGNPGGTVRLSLERHFKRLKVSVWNEGPGFPEIEKKRLFRKFSRLQSQELIKRKGAGVGLYLTWNIMQYHGGKIRAESEHGMWALFSFDLPQYMDLCVID